MFGRRRRMHCNHHLHHRVHNSLVTQCTFPIYREGLAALHFTAEKGNYLRQLQTGEEKAKEKKLNIFQNWVPEDDKEPEVEGKCHIST